MKSKNLKIVYWIISSLILLIGLAISLYFGIQPKTVPKIKISSVETPSDFGQAIHHRLRQELGSAPVIFLGIMPDKSEQKDLVKGLVDGIRSQQSNLSLLVDFRFRLKEEINADHEINPDVGVSDIITILKKVLNDKKQVVLITSVSNTSHFIKRDLINLIRHERGFEQTLAISIVDFPSKRDEEINASIICKDESLDPTGFNSKLGCIIQSKARTVYYKQNHPKAFVGLMDQVGLNDYLALFRKNSVQP